MYKCFLSNVKDTLQNSPTHISPRLVCRPIEMNICECTLPDVCHTVYEKTINIHVCKYVRQMGETARGKCSGARCRNHLVELDRQTEMIEQRWRGRRRGSQISKQILFHHSKGKHFCSFNLEKAREAKSNYFSPCKRRLCKIFTPSQERREVVGFSASAGRNRKNRRGFPTAWGTEKLHQVNKMQRWPSSGREFQGIPKRESGGMESSGIAHSRSLRW